MSDQRPDPDLLLSRLTEQEGSVRQRGRLKIFFGAVAGVGKTYSMLETARKVKVDGLDVVVGVVETHGRAETAALLEGLEVLPLKSIEYRGARLTEFDIDAALSRNPAVLLVDELAHTNVPGSRHLKRYQDVQELLQSGIDVYTTLNVQHIESLHDVVSQITRVVIRERVPDSLLEEAFEIELIDLPPDELIQRLKEGKVYIPTQVRGALENFFRKGNLIALRELALRVAAERVDAQMHAYRESYQISEPWPAAEKILVCVSTSPLSVRLVRAAKRMASALRAKWMVVYVETPRQLRLEEADRNRVVDTLRLAEQLGAETIELTGTRASEEVIKCARRHNVSKIIVGKPALPRWREMLFGSTVDEIVRSSGAIDVYVITGEESELVESPRGVFRSRTAPAGYLWAACFVGVATVMARLMLPFFEPTNVVMIYMLVIVVVATRYGRGPSILASVLSVGSFDFFFVPPHFTFAVSDAQYVFTFIVMLTVGLVISTLTVQVRQQAEGARLREERTSALYSMSRELSSSINLDDLAKIGVKHVGEVFDSQVALFLPGESGKVELFCTGDENHRLTHVDEGVAQWSFQNRRLAGLGTDTLPAAKALYVPLSGFNRVIGVMAVRPVRSIQQMSPDRLRLLETFANQMAVACERAYLSKEIEKNRLLVKTEQMRSSLLSSVSHDLRTPLATIVGAASSIIEGSAALDVESCRSMAKEIYEESARLNRLVKNLLDMTRLEAETLTVRRELHPVDDIVGAALSALDDDIKERPVRISLPEPIPLISVDAVLIQQALVNLLDNAVKYSPPGTDIDIEVREENGWIEFSISDRGRGVPDEIKARVFDKFFRHSEASGAGVGLGLAVCKGIIEAHGGTIEVLDRVGEGACFRFRLPGRLEDIKVASGAIQTQGSPRGAG